MNLPKHYRFTDADYEACCQIEAAKVFCAVEQMQPLTPEEEDFTATLNFAFRIKAQIGRWPTFGEVQEIIGRENERLSKIADAKEAEFYGKPK